MTISGTAPPDLAVRIAAITEHKARADALTAMIAAQVAVTGGDLADSTHAHLLTDQLVTSVTNHVQSVCADAFAIFLDLAGLDSAAYYKLLLEAHYNLPGARAERGRLAELYNGIPRLEPAIDALCAATDSYRERFADDADDAVARIEEAAVMLVGERIGADRVVAVDVGSLNVDERLVAIGSSSVNVSWVANIAVFAVNATVAAYMCTDRGAVDLGVDAPLSDRVEFSRRVCDALDSGLALDDAYSAAFVYAAGAPCNQAPSRDSR